MKIVSWNINRQERAWEELVDSQYDIAMIQEANPQPQISKDATEKLVARTVAYSRSGMNGYELRDHRREQVFRATGRYFANFSSSVNRRVVTGAW